MQHLSNFIAFRDAFNTNLTILLFGILALFLTYFLLNYSFSKKHLKTNSTFRMFGLVNVMLLPVLALFALNTSFQHDLTAVKQEALVTGKSDEFRFVEKHGFKTIQRKDHYQEVVSYKNKEYKNDFVKGPVVWTTVSTLEEN